MLNPVRFDDLYVVIQEQEVITRGMPCPDVHLPCDIERFKEVHQLAAAVGDRLEGLRPQIAVVHHDDFVIFVGS